MTTPWAVGLRIGLELEDVGLQQQHLEQLVEAGALLRGDVDEDRRPAPLLGLQPERRELGAHALGVGVGAVDLVDRDDDRHLGGLGVVDRLDGLRHDAVVGRDDQHHDVGDAAGAGAHGGERLVARGVQERDGAAVVADDRLVRADVLRDAAGLAGDDARLADGVEQARLAVVDVAHDRDDRRARDEILGASSNDLLGGSTSSAALVIVISRSSSAPIISTASLVSVCVMPTSSPRPIMIFWICAVEMPSAAARSLTVTPERTVAGPVGAGTSSRRSVRCSPRPRRPRWRVSRCGREAAVSITTRRRPPSCGPRCGRATREPPGGLAPAPLPPAGGRPPPAAGPLAAGLRARRPGRGRRGTRGPGRGRRAGAAAAGAARASAPARGAPRGWSGRRRARALPRPRRRCRPAGARRPRRGGGPPLRDRARARGQCRLHAFSASGDGTVSGCRGAPRRAPDGLPEPVGDAHARAQGAAQQPRARASARSRRPRPAQTYAPRPGARPTASAPARVGVQRDELVLRAPGRRTRSTCASPLAIRRPRPWPDGRAGRRSASPGSRCSGSACPTP